MTNLNNAQTTTVTAAARKSALAAPALVESIKPKLKAIKRTDKNKIMHSAISANIATVERLSARKTALSSDDINAMGLNGTQARYRFELLSKHADIVEYVEEMGLDSVNVLRRNKYSKYAHAINYALKGHYGAATEQAGYMQKFIEYVMKGAKNAHDTQEFDPITKDTTYRITEIASVLGKPNEMGELSSVAYQTQPAAVCNVLEELGFARFNKNGAQGTLTLFADSALVKAFNKNAEKTQ